MVSINKKCILLLFIIVLSVATFYFLMNFRKVNSTAIDLGDNSLSSSIEFVINSNIPNHFFVGSGTTIGLLNTSQNKFHFPLKIKTALNKKHGEVLDAQTLKNGSFYVVGEGYGMLFNSNLKLMRQDDLNEIIDGSFSIEPGETFGAFPFAHIENRPISIFDSPFNNILKNIPNEIYPQFIKSHKELYLVTIRLLENDKKEISSNINDNIIIRKVSNLETVKKYIPGGQISTNIAGPLTNTFTIGTHDGRVISATISPWSILLEKQVSKNRIGAICPINDQIIAVGDFRGLVYLLNLKSGSITQLPEMSVRHYGVTSMAYQKVNLPINSGHRNKSVYY